MNQVQIVAGNSSSGIIETPSFKVPTINIGDRESGRTRADNIIDCKPSIKSIEKAFNQGLSSEFIDSLTDMKNPYEKENTSLIIKDIIKNFDSKDKLKKVFYDL